MVSMMSRALLLCASVALAAAGDCSHCSSMSGPVSNTNLAIECTACSGCYVKIGGSSRFECVAGSGGSTGLGGTGTGTGTGGSGGSTNDVCAEPCEDKGQVACVYAAECGCGINDDGSCMHIDDAGLGGGIIFLIVLLCLCAVCGSAFAAWFFLVKKSGEQATQKSKADETEAASYSKL